MGQLGGAKGRVRGACAVRVREDAKWPVELRRAVMVLGPTIVIILILSIVEDAAGITSGWRFLLNQIPCWLLIAWFDTRLGPR